MRFGGVTRRSFGRASVSVSAILLMTFGPIAAARAQSEIEDLMGPAAEKVSNAELSDQRGGFYIKGMVFHIAVEKRKTINGELEYASRLVGGQNGWTETVETATKAASAAAASAAAIGEAYKNGPTQTPPAPTNTTVTSAPANSGSSGTPPGGLPGVTDNTSVILGGVDIDVSTETAPPDLPDVTPPSVSDPAPSVASTPPSKSEHPSSTEPAGPSLPQLAGMAPTTEAASAPTPPPPPKKLQIVTSNEPLTNETVQRILYGPTVVINDKNNVVIQEFTQITIDVRNFTDLRADTLRGLMAASIADLIRRYTVNGLTNF